MTSIHCLSTANQFDENENEDQLTFTNITNDSKTNIENFSNSAAKPKIQLKTLPTMTDEQEKTQGLSFSPISPNDENKGDNLINSPQISIDDERKPRISFKEEVKTISQAKIEPLNSKFTEVEQEEEEEDEDDFPAPRQKSNTFTAGYISTHIPCEQKKSRFGLRLNLNIKNPYASEDSDIMDPEVDSSQDYDSTDDSFTLTTVNPKSEFAKRRSSFFKSFKPESLRLITPMNNDKPESKAPAILKKENFDERFEMHEKLGEGCHSIVRRCQKKEDSPLTSFAVKIIAYKDPEYLFEILQEERVLSLLNHKNIIKYDSFFLEKDKKKAYIVSEYALGKPLAHYVHNKRTFNMREIRGIAKQTLKAIAHMHSKGIIHRDLSYNNIMYDPQTEQIKVIDFTVSKILTIQKLLTNTGTLNFKAPEMLSGQFYSHSIDIFALGVNLFALLFGHLPFNDNSDKQVIDHIVNKNPLEFYKTKEGHDPLLLHFLETLLEKNPLKRSTALQALKHPWINQKITCDDLKSQKFRKTLKNGISASTVAELDDVDQEQDTFTSFNQFMVKTLVNLQDD